MRSIHRQGLTLAAATLLALAPTAAMPARAGVSPPPVEAVNDVYEVDEDSPLDVSAPGVLANDLPSGEGVCVTEFDIDGLIGDFGAPQTLDGSFTYTPPSNFHGTTSFTYGIATKSGDPCPLEAEDTATVTITVNPVNDPPNATADSFTALANRTLNVADPGVLNNDSDIDSDSLTAHKVSNPAHGIVTLAADGGFSYTPAGGYTGPDSFSYRASDGTAFSATRVVTLNVTAVPTPPPTPVPPTPSPAPTPTPEVTIEPSPSASVEPAASVEPSASPGASPSASASLEPGATPAPDPSGDSGGLSLPVLIVLLLLIALLAFGAAVYVPKLINRQRADEPFDDDYPDDR